MEQLSSECADILRGEGENHYFWQGVSENLPQVRTQHEKDRALETTKAPRRRFCLNLVGRAGFEPATN